MRETVDIQQTFYCSPEVVWFPIRLAIVYTSPSDRPRLAELICASLTCPQQDTFTDDQRAFGVAV